MKRIFICFAILIACSQSIWGQNIAVPQIDKRLAEQSQQLKAKRQSSGMYKKSLGTNVSQAKRDLEKARDYFADKEYEKAYALYSKTSVQSLMDKDDYGHFAVICEKKGSYDEFMKWYTKAAELGSVSSQFILGINYSGDTYPRDNAKAVYWFKKVQSEKNILGELSQFFLYKIYSEGGYGVVKNDSEANRWLQTLANNPNATMFGAVAKGLLSRQTTK